MPSSKKTPEERIKELQEKGEVFPASNDYIYKVIMTNCFLFKADMTYQITDIPKDLILKTYYEKNTEFVISNALERGKRSDILFGIEGYIINYELNNKYSLATIIRNDDYLDKIKIDISNKNYTYENMPKAIQINLNNFNHLNKKNVKEVFKSRDENGVVENVKWEKYHLSFKKVYKKYKKGLELSKLEKEMLILRLRKIDEIERIVEGDVELMEVANELKRLSLDIKSGWWALSSANIASAGKNIIAWSLVTPSIIYLLLIASICFLTSVLKALVAVSLSLLDKSVLTIIW